MSNTLTWDEWVKAQRIALWTFGLQNDYEQRCLASDRDQS
jgi:hypothetical protein